MQLALLTKLSCQLGAGLTLHAAHPQYLLSFASSNDVLLLLQCVMQFVACLETELSNLQADRLGFEAAFSAEEYTDMLTRWQGKLQRAQAGEQRWGRLTARKPQ